MPKIKCPQCGEPSKGRPMQRGTGYHKFCYEEAIRAQERKREAAMLLKAERDQYWDRWVNKTLAREESGTDLVIPGKVIRRGSRGKRDRMGAALAGRVFEDASMADSRFPSLRPSKGSSSRTTSKMNPISTILKTSHRRHTT